MQYVSTGSWQRERLFKKTPLSTLEKILDDAVAYGLESVSIHGSGEPTLNHDMPDAVALVKERGLKMYLFYKRIQID